jgi:hypothetical protein
MALPAAAFSYDPARAGNLVTHGADDRAETGTVRWLPVSGGVVVECLVGEAGDLPAPGDVAHDGNAPRRLWIDAQNIPKAHAATEVFDAEAEGTVGTEPTKSDIVRFPCCGDRGHRRHRPGTEQTNTLDRPGVAVQRDKPGGIGDRADESAVGGPVEFERPQRHVFPRAHADEVAGQDRASAGVKMRGSG